MCNFFRYLILAAIVFCHSCIALESSCSQFLQYIQNNLPEQGILKSSGNFVYVALDDEYIHKLFTFIQDDGFEEPPYFGQLYDIGAHISVAYPREWGDEETFVIPEIGEMVYFRATGCQIWEPSHWEGIERVWVILVDAPVLDLLRDKYGFPPGFNFHITIAVKSKIAKAA